MRLVAGLVVLVVAAVGGIRAQGQAADTTAVLLRPARVFDGAAMHEGWAVRVVGDRIDAAGPSASIDAGNARVVDLAGFTLTPDSSKAIRTSCCTRTTKRRGSSRLRTRRLR